MEWRLVHSRYGTKFSLKVLGLILFSGSDEHMLLRIPQEPETLAADSATSASNNKIRFLEDMSIAVRCVVHIPVTVIVLFRL
jgi:hypothetical protein